MKKLLAIMLAARLVIPLGVVFTSAEESNIAAGKSYTFTGKYTDSNQVVLYPDSGDSELTDGTIGTKDDIGYSPAIWTGLNWRGENAICEDTTWSPSTVALNKKVVDLLPV